MLKRTVLLTIILMFFVAIGGAFATSPTSEPVKKPEVKVVVPVPVEKIVSEKVQIGYGKIDFPYSEGNWNNVQNARRALEFVNGTIIPPGEEFSYNIVVGERTYEKEFVDGYNSQDQLVVGGGVCRGSSVIHLGMLEAQANGYALKTIERHPHNPACHYLPEGMDAMVQWGSCDFRFLNSTEYPIKIGTQTTYLEKETRIEVWIVQLQQKTVIEYQ